MKKIDIKGVYALFGENKGKELLNFLGAWCCEGSFANICNHIKDCLGISGAGSTTKFLNEQGEWVTVSGGTLSTENGLSNSNPTTAKLGGTLIENTLIEQDGNDFTIKDGNYFSGKVSDVSTILPFPINDPFIGNGYFDAGSNEGLVNGFINNSAGRYITMLMRNGYTHSMTIDGNNNGFDFSTNETNSSSNFGIGTQSINIKNSDLVTGEFSSISLNKNTGIRFSSELGSYTFPKSDGNLDDSLTTNGVGQLVWAPSKIKIQERLGVLTGGTATLANTPKFIYGVYKNGLFLTEGITEDYIVSGDTITFNTPLVSDKITIVYEY